MRQGTAVPTTGLWDVASDSQRRGMFITSGCIMEWIALCFLTFRHRSVGLITTGTDSIAMRARPAAPHGLGAFLGPPVRPATALAVLLAMVSPNPSAFAPTEQFIRIAASLAALAVQIFGCAGRVIVDITRSEAYV